MTDDLSLEDIYEILGRAGAVEEQAERYRREAPRTLYVAPGDLSFDLPDSYLTLGNLELVLKTHLLDFWRKEYTHYLRTEDVEQKFPWLIIVQRTPFLMPWSSHFYFRNHIQAYYLQQLAWLCGAYVNTRLQHYDGWIAGHPRSVALWKALRPMAISNLERLGRLSYWEFAITQRTPGIKAPSYVKGFLESGVVMVADQLRTHLSRNMQSKEARMFAAHRRRAALMAFQHAFPQDRSSATLFRDRRARKPSWEYWRQDKWRMNGHIRATKGTTQMPSAEYMETRGEGVEPLLSEFWYWPIVSGKTRKNRLDALPDMPSSWDYDTSVITQGQLLQPGWSTRMGIPVGLAHPEDLPLEPLHRFD